MGSESLAGFDWRTTNRGGIAATAAKSSGTAVTRKAGRGLTAF